MDSVDVVIVGAGAAGMMCAIEAGRRGRKVLVIDHAKAAGEKIRISGGGRCNFTNIHAGPGNFISQNPHFCISALKRYTQHDFVALVRAHGIAFHEKTLGQLFCDGSATQIIGLLLDGMKRHGVELRLNTSVRDIEKTPDGFAVKLTEGAVRCSSLVVASGGKSIPKMGASGWGYDLAAQFGQHRIDRLHALMALRRQHEDLRPPVRRILATVDQSFHDEKVDEAHDGRALEARLLRHRALPCLAAQLPQCQQGHGGRMRNSVAVQPFVGAAPPKARHRRHQLPEIVHLIQVIATPAQKHCMQSFSMQCNCNKQQIRKKARQACLP